MVTKALSLPWPRSGPSPYLLLSSLLALLVGALVALPLLTLLLSSLKPEGVLPFEGSALTSKHYATVYANPATYRLLLNTVLYATSSLAIGLAIAFLIAWLVERTDMPLNNVVYTAMFVPMATPGMIIALGWVLLLNPQNGVVNLLLRQVSGWSGKGPFDIYTLGGMVFVTGLAVVPTMFLMLAGLMRNMDPNLEEAAQMAGAGLSRVFQHITAPLLLPGLLSVLIYFSIILIESFEIPLTIGLSAGVHVLATQIFVATRVESFQPSHGVAAAYAMIGLVLAVGLIALYMRVTRQAERFAVVTGKGYRPRKIPLGAWRYGALGFVGLYLLLDIGLPFAILLWSSLQRFYQPPSLEGLSRLGLSRYESVFLLDTRFLGIMTNTLLVMAGTATLGMLLAALVSWIVVRARASSARWLGILAFLPTAMPGILLALSVLLFSVGTPIYGTVWVIVVGQIIRYLPYGTRTMDAAILQIQKDLEEVAMTSGAGWLTTFRTILVPLVAPALITGWLWMAAHSMRDLTFPLMLSSTNNTVLSAVLWEYWAGGQITDAAAVAVFLVLVLVLLVLPMRLYTVKVGSSRA